MSSRKTSLIELDTWSELGTFVLDIHNPDHVISISNLFADEFSISLFQSSLQGTITMRDIE